MVIMNKIRIIISGGGTGGHIFPALAIARAIEKKHLANAYLLVGDNQQAKLNLARQVAAYLNCSNTASGTDVSTASCLKQESVSDSSCQNCRWIYEGKHPQAWLELVPKEGGSTKIPVEAARRLSEEFTKTSSYRRVAVIYDASQDVFHRPSANALLKTIEEPRGNGVFFLFARSEDSVLKTIVSRSQVIPVIMPGSKLSGPFGRMISGPSGVSSLASLLGDLEEEQALALKDMKDLPFYEWSRSLKRGGFKVARAHLSTTAQALELVDSMLRSLGNSDSPDLVLDGAFLTEVEIIGTTAIDSPILTDYLNQLLRLCEEAKWRIGRYVGKKAVLESFAFQWNQLRLSIT